MDNLLTNSRLSCLKTCPKKHEIMYELGIRKERTSDAMFVGTMVHEGLHLLASGMSADEAMNAMRNIDPPSGCRTDEHLADFYVDRETAARLVFGYGWRWSEDALSEQVIASELSFELPIVNPKTGRASRGYTCAGKIDKIARLTDGRLAIVEHKTSGEDISNGSDYWLRLRIDHQISHYMIAARRLGYQVDTIVYDVIGKPQIRPRQPQYQMTAADKVAYAQGLYFGEQFEQSELDAALEAKKETPTMYGARLLAQIYEQPDRYFQRQEIPRIAQDLHDYEVELWAQTAYIHERRKSGVWFRNTNACRTHYGNCECFELCVGGWNSGQPAPQGFVKLENVHPELGTENNVKGTTSQGIAANATGAASQ